MFSSDQLGATSSLPHVPRKHEFSSASFFCHLVSKLRWLLLSGGGVVTHLFWTKGERGEVTVAEEG